VTAATAAFATPTSAKVAPKPAPKAGLFGSKYADAAPATPAKPAAKAAPKGDLYASKYANPEPATPALHNKSPNTGLNGFGAMKSALPIVRTPSPIFGDSNLMPYKGVNPSKKWVAFNSQPARGSMMVGSHNAARVIGTHPRSSAMPNNEADEDSDSTL
jgi:hypothetical protein